jgi:hypothetical protein
MLLLEGLLTSGELSQVKSRLNDVMKTLRKENPEIESWELGAVTVVTKKSAGRTATAEKA